MGELTLIRKNLLRKPLRFILMLLVIVVAFLLFGLLQSIQVLLSGGANGGDNNRLIVSNRINFTQPFPYAYTDRVAALAGVKDVAHASWFGGYYQNQRNFLVSYAVDPLAYLRVYPELHLAAAQKKSFVHERTGLMVGSSTAARFGWKLGQQVSLSSNIFSNAAGTHNWDFIVSAIYTNDKPNGDEQAVYFHYEYFNETRSFGRDKIGSLVVVPSDPTAGDKLARLIDAQFANSTDETNTVSEQQFAKAFMAQFGNIGLIVSVVVGAAFITMLLVVGNTMMMNARARIGEIGILKTLGFPQRRIVRVIMGEALLLSLLGALGGLLLANGIVAVLRTSPNFAALTMTSLIWSVGLIAAIVFGLLTSAAPVRNALKLNVVTALGRA